MSEAARDGIAQTGTYDYLIVGAAPRVTIYSDKVPAELSARSRKLSAILPTRSPTALKWWSGEAPRAWPHQAEVVRLANDIPFGRAAYFYTKDLGRAFRVAEEFEYGVVGINAAIISTEVAPFGGVKESGLGREGSSHGIEELVEIKYMLIGGLCA